MYSAVTAESEKEDQTYLDPCCYLSGYEEEDNGDEGETMRNDEEHFIVEVPHRRAHRDASYSSPLESLGAPNSGSEELPEQSSSCTLPFSSPTNRQVEHSSPDLSDGTNAVSSDTSEPLLGPERPAEGPVSLDGPSGYTPSSNSRRSHVARESKDLSTASFATSPPATPGKSLESAPISSTEPPSVDIGRREATAATIASSACLVMAQPAEGKFLGRPNEAEAAATKSRAADRPAVEVPGGVASAGAGPAATAGSFIGKAGGAAAATAMVHWDDWADKRDVRDMWQRMDVAEEWANRSLDGGKVPFLRTNDGKAVVTQREMRGLAEIIIARHFRGRVDPRVVCAIAEVESSRQPLAYRFEPARGEASTGLMQVLQSTAEWLARDMGYRVYSADWRVTGLYRPFEAVYFGAAYLNWLSTYQNKPRDEEFIVRGYNGGPQGYALAATERYWEKYKRAKQALPWTSAGPAPQGVGATSPPPASPPRGGWEYWDAYASPEDMREMWSNASVSKDWKAAGESGGRVRFARNEQMQPFLTRTELRAAAETVVQKHFAKQVDDAVLCAIVEAGSRRLLHGDGAHDGLVPLGFGVVQRLSREMGFRAYRADSRRDMLRPFTALYFGAAYLSLLSQYRGQKRGEEFLVKAFIGGPEGTETGESRAFWERYGEARRQYPSMKKGGGICNLL